MRAGNETGQTGSLRTILPAVPAPPWAHRSATRSSRYPESPPATGDVWPDREEGRTSGLPVAEATVQRGRAWNGTARTGQSTIWQNEQW